MSLLTRLLLVGFDEQSTQPISDALSNSNRFELEVVSADELSKHLTDSNPSWDAVVFCAGSKYPPEEDLAQARQQLVFCPIVVVTDAMPDRVDFSLTHRVEPPARQILDSESQATYGPQSSASDVLTLTRDDFSPHALQLLLQAARELKSASAKLASLEAMASIKCDLLARQNEFIHNLTNQWCHEVRSPLTSARQYTTLISRKQVSESEAPTVAARVLRSLDDLSMLVDDMTVLSQSDIPLRGLRRKVTNLTDVAGEVEHLLRDRARMENISFDTHLPDTLPNVFADPDAVGQAIRNLAANSLQHASEGQRVKLWAEPDDEGNVLIGIEDQFDSVDGDEMEEAFSEFCNAEMSLVAGLKGRARGLAVARRLLELNLSKLRLESLGDRGSVFVFQLPSAEPTRLIRHYLSVLRTRRPRTSVSLLKFRAVTSGPFEPSCAIDDFLQTSATADDLVLQTGPLEWTGLLCGNRHEISGRLRLLDSLWAVRREQDHWLELPTVEWQRLGAWMLESNESTISGQFLEACGIEQAASRASRRVLVVDNHPERILRLTHKFEVAGYDVFVAGSGDEGVLSAAENHPDAIVLDASTSELNEISTLQQLRRQDTSQAAPIIMLASNMRQQQQALEHGAKAIFDQSLHAGKVVEAVQRSLATK